VIETAHARPKATPKARPKRAEPSDQQQDMARARREHVERLLRLAEHLAPSDRSLIEGIYNRGMSAAELARAAGVQPTTIRRRARRLLNRMAGSMYRFVLANRERWPKRRRDVADLIYLQGVGQRETAAALNCSLHEVRREAQYVRAAHEEAQAQEQQQWGTGG